MKRICVVMFAIALTGCGSAEEPADRLRKAADQSTPEAAAVLESEAHDLESGNGITAEEHVQTALENAGEAQIQNRQ